MFDTPAAFASPEDIANRALQRLGLVRINAFSDIDRAAYECAFCYDKLRRAELRRNTWVFSTRKAALRPLASNITGLISNSQYTAQSGPGTGTLWLKPAVWSATTTYTPGAIVMDPNVPGLVWTSMAHENLNNAPGVGIGSVWDVYYGPKIVVPYDQTEAYWAGELVYIQNPNTQAIVVYRSLTNNNGNGNIQITVTTEPTAGNNQTIISASIASDGAGNPWILSEWNPAITYNRDQVVTYKWELYRSAVELNFGNPPPGSNSQWIDCGPADAPTVALASNMNWLPIPATVSSNIIPYPLGAGPVWEANTRNAFPLPNGYLRQCPQDPTQGGVSYLGAPGGLTYTDWVLENGFLTTRENRTILFRFIADITEVSRMDDMFCEGLACRMATEMQPTLAPDLPANRAMLLRADYKTYMGEARIVNAIESGSDQPPEDDYISCRA
jgi:hypothetical protein